MRFKIRTASNKTYLVDEDKIQTPKSFVKDAEALEENIDDIDDTEEINEKEEVVETKAEDAKDDEEIGTLDLTKKEVKLLKKLLDNADLLLALVDGKEDQETDKDSKKSEKVDEDKKAEDSDFDFDEDGVGLEEEDPENLNETKSVEEEEVVETKDSCDVDDIRIQDSKKSFGSIERKTSITDSDLVEDEIADAWAKYYGGR